MTITVAILADQLLIDHPAIAHAQSLAAPGDIRIMLVESQARIALRPYQHHKLTLVLSALRHYAAWLRQSGFVVDYYQSANWRTALAQHVETHPDTQIITMAGAEYAARQAQQRWQTWCNRPVIIIANQQFLVSQHNPIANTPATKRTVMEPFYRAMRHHFGVLMDADGQPVGGQWNYDAANRKPLPATRPIPPHFGITPDDITQQVIAEVAAMPHAHGTPAPFGLAVDHAGAQSALLHFVTHRLPFFGDYEDAMTQRDHVLFHSVLSPYLNLGLLTPLECIRAAERAYHDGWAPINAVEGFVRQILGWREYMYVQYWRHMPGLRTLNHWQAERPLPEWFWQGQSGMRCLDTTIATVWRHGYSHHIERLMLISNFCVLAGIDPVAVNHWFLAGYIDAYDWVMWPNVSGMGLNADGGLIATKPYIASATYIKKMGDYCGSCHYNPALRHGTAACPFNLLYWNFLLTHEQTLRANPRMGPAVLGLKHLSTDDRHHIREQATIWLAQLASNDK